MSVNLPTWSCQIVELCSPTVQKRTAAVIKKNLVSSFQWNYIASYLDLPVWVPNGSVTGCKLEGVNSPSLRGRKMAPVGRCWHETSSIWKLFVDPGFFFAHLPHSRWMFFGLFLSIVRYLRSLSWWHDFDQDFPSSICWLKINDFVSTIPRPGGLGKQSSNVPW